MINVQNYKDAFPKLLEILTSHSSLHRYHVNSHKVISFYWINCEFVYIVIVNYDHSEVASNWPMHSFLICMRSVVLGAWSISELMTCRRTWRRREHFAYLSSLIRQLNRYRVFFRTFTTFTNHNQRGTSKDCWHWASSGFKSQHFWPQSRKEKQTRFSKRLHIVAGILS